MNGEPFPREFPTHTNLGSLSANQERALLTINRTLTRGYKQFMKILFYALIAVLALGFVFRRDADWVRMAMYASLAVLLFWMFTDRLQKYVNETFQASKYMRRFRDGIDGRLWFDDAGLHYADDFTTETRVWASFDVIEIDASGVFFLFFAMGLFLPRNEFSSEADMMAFAQECRARCSAELEFRDKLAAKSGGR